MPGDECGVVHRRSGAREQIALREVDRSGGERVAQRHIVCTTAVPEAAAPAAGLAARRGDQNARHRRGHAASRPTLSPYIRGKSPAGDFERHREVAVWRQSGFGQLHIRADPIAESANPRSKSSRRSMAAAMSSPKRSGEQAKAGMPSSARAAAFVVVAGRTVVAEREQCDDAHPGFNEFGHPTEHFGVIAALEQVADEAPGWCRQAW